MMPRGDSNSTTRDIQYSIIRLNMNGAYKKVFPVAQRWLMNSPDYALGNDVASRRRNAFTFGSGGFWGRFQVELRNLGTNESVEDVHHTKEKMQRDFFMTVYEKPSPKFHRRSVMLRSLGMKLLSRLLLLVCSLSALFLLLLLSRCGLNLEEERSEHETGVSPSVSQQHEKRSGNQRILDGYQEPKEFLPVTVSSYVQQKEDDVKSYVQALQQKEIEQKLEIERLVSEIQTLKMQLRRYNSLHLPPYQEGERNIPDECNLHVKRQINSAEILKGVQLNNEYEVIPYNHFTLNRIHPVDLSLGKRVVEKPIGYKRRDLTEALFKALEVLNAETGNKTKGYKGKDGKPITDRNISPDLDKTNKKFNLNSTRFKKFKRNYSLGDFVEGLYRIDQTTGTQYELYFTDKFTNVPNHVKVTVMRPFAPLAYISSESLPKTREKELVHVILPLSGRTDTFQSFMDKFVKIGLRNDKRVHLTVVYFGENGLSEARTIMSKIAQQRGNGNSLRLLALNETFSRAKGLRVGAEKIWDNQPTDPNTNDVLLFMCDVDIIFSSRFLDRCRWNTKPGKQVYYPIVFSLYNPHVVYTLQGKEIPSETDQVVVSRDTGYWRDFGYGMTCQYRSDFLKIRGFDEDIVGWGGEDVLLYRKYVKSGIKVIRATDPGIFHVWHPKICSTTVGGQQVTAEQYKACIRSRALNEASHAQLGFLAFKDEISKNLNKFQKSNKSSKSAQKNGRN